jgi:hypothetical protein
VHTSHARSSVLNMAILKTDIRWTQKAEAHFVEVAVEILSQIERLSDLGMQVCRWCVGPFRDYSVGDWRNIAIALTDPGPRRTDGASL